MSDKTAAALAKVVAPLITSIEAGVADPDGWVAPWHKADAFLLLPYCPATGRHYTAGNRLSLSIASMFFGAEPHWGTYNQWKGLSKHSKACNASATGKGRHERRPDCGPDCQLVNVRKGEHSIAYAFRPLTKKVENDDGDTKTVMYGFAPFAVFHSGQVDGYTLPTATPVELLDGDAAADVDAAFEFAHRVGARVVEDALAGAAYLPYSDEVRLPSRDRWTDSHGCWSTVAHELTHWTGHESRLNRHLSGRFGSEAYAAEELVAELGAAFTLAELGRSAEPRPDHAHYLANWLRVLKADPKHLLTVASHAEKASRFVLEAADHTLEEAA